MCVVFYCKAIWAKWWLEEKAMWLRFKYQTQTALHAQSRILAEHTPTYLIVLSTAQVQVSRGRPVGNAYECTHIYRQPRAQPRRDKDRWAALERLVYLGRKYENMDLDAGTAGKEQVAGTGTRTSTCVSRYST